MYSCDPMERRGAFGPVQTFEGTCRGSYIAGRSCLWYVFFPIIPVSLHCHSYLEPGFTSTSLLTVLGPCFPTFPSFPVSCVLFGVRPPTGTIQLYTHCYTHRCTHRCTHSCSCTHIVERGFHTRGSILFSQAFSPDIDHPCIRVVLSSPCPLPIDLLPCLTLNMIPSQAMQIGTQMYPPQRPIISRTTFHPHRTIHGMHQNNRHGHR